MTDTLDTVLEDVRAFANALKLAGNAVGGQRVDELAERLDAATEDVRRWLNERDAHLRSGIALRTLQRRFKEWLVTGHARYSDKGHREYRLDIVPLKDAQRDAAHKRARARLGRVA